MTAVSDLSLMLCAMHHDMGDGLPKALRQRAIEMERRFNEMSRRTSELQTDEACLALPHPARVKAVALSHPDFMPIAVVGVRHEQMLLEMLRNRIATRDVWFALDSAECANFMRFMHLNSTNHAIDGGFNGGSSGAIFQAMRYAHAGGTLFTIDDGLLEMLEHTDIDLDIPMGDIRLPFDNVYIELGRKRTGDGAKGKRTLHNDVSGEHIVEGAYVSRTRRSDNAGGNEVFELTMTGSPLGKRDLGDDAIEWVSMESTGTRTIREALHDAFTSGGYLFGEEGREKEVRIAPSERLKLLEQRSAQRLELVIKALLYLSMPNLRQEVYRDRSEADRLVARTQSNAHKRKAMRQAARTYDTVLILPPLMSSQAVGAAAPGDDAARTMRSHWRRGHFRTQRHGEGYSLRKTIWIAPVLVNAENVASLVDKAQYVAPAPGAR